MVCDSIGQILGDGHLHRERAVVGEHIAAVDPLDPEMLADQQRRVARAIDEQIALDPLAAARADRRRYRRPTAASTPTTSSRT